MRSLSLSLCSSYELLSFFLINHWGHRCFCTAVLAVHSSTSENKASETITRYSTYRSQLQEREQHTPNDVRRSSITSKQQGTLSVMSTTHARTSRARPAHHDTRVARRSEGVHLNERKHSTHTTQLNNKDTAHKQRASATSHNPPSRSSLKRAMTTQDWASHFWITLVEEEGESKLIAGISGNQEGILHLKPCSDLALCCFFGAPNSILRESSNWRKKVDDPTWFSCTTTFSRR